MTTTGLKVYVTESTVRIRVNESGPSETRDLELDPDVALEAAKELREAARKLGVKGG